MLLLLVSLRRMLLSTGFLFALLMSCLDASSVPVGFERGVDAAIYESISGIKTRTQSSEHGVVATVKHGDLLGGNCVERHIWFLGDPEAMEQDGQLGDPNLVDAPAASMIAAIELVLTVRSTRACNVAEGSARNRHVQSGTQYRRAIVFVTLNSNHGFCSEPSAYCTQIADFEACLYSNR